MSSSAATVQRGLFFDAAAIALFALLARLAHGGLTLSSWLNTTWPFLIGVAVGWGLVTIGVKAPQALVVWLSAVVTGLGIWALRHGEVPHVSFIIVASVVSAVLLFGWRFFAARSR